MRHAAQVCAALVIIGLSSCAPRPPNEEKLKEKPKIGDEAWVDPLPPTVTPPWRDLVRHTKIPLPGRATHPSGSWDGKWLVYASTETSPTPQIMRRAIDGVAPMQLTSNNADNLFPRISPKGDKVAFASNVGGNWDIYVIDIDSPAAWMQVTHSKNDSIAPSWSPDGQRIVYCTKTLAGYWQIVIVNVGTGIPTFLGPGMYPDWSPDGKSIAFQSQPRGNARSAIWVVQTDGTGLHEIAADRHKEWAAINPRWSRDGKWIAYATVMRSPESRIYGAPDEADDIWVIAPDGQFDTRLIEDPTPEWWPAWCGDRLLFVSRREEGQNIYSVKPHRLDDTGGER